MTLKELLAGRRVVASVSGGKDSGALSLWLHEQGIEHDRVFLDTGWEHEWTYEYLRGELPEKIGPITWVTPQRQMVELIRKRGMFPSRMRRFCTQELKVFPMRDYIAARLNANDDIVNAVGIRRDESRSRAAALEWEWSDTLDCDVWRPLVQWSKDDVIRIHRKHALNPNPLYYRLGMSRVGCWPCIHARKKEIHTMAESDPKRIALVRQLEQDVAKSAATRYAAKGETFESLGYTKPTWFQAPIGSTGEGWPIDRVIEWARTSRGGRQLELFAPPSHSGCVRWGLCEP